MKKYVANWEGKKIVLTKKDYKILLKRFEAKNFELINSFYVNDVICPLCKKYIKDTCNGCTFSKFDADNSFGCIEILNQIYEEIKVGTCLNLGRNQINFSLARKDEATKLINYVKGLLLTEFQLVEREN